MFSMHYYVTDEGYNTILLVYRSKLDPIFSISYIMSLSLIHITDTRCGPFLLLFPAAPPPAVQIPRYLNDR